MDNIRQVGRRIREVNKESDHNLRRYSKDFPQVERAVDSMHPNSPYKLEFPLSDHPHIVSLNLYIKEPQLPCEPQPIEQFAGASSVCGTVPEGTTMFYNPLSTNVGGFSMVNGQIQVPIDGYYQIHQQHVFGGVAISNNFVLVTIQANGGTVATDIQSFPGELAPAFGASNLYATVFLAAGSLVTGTIQFSGIAFQSPFNLCGFNAGSFISVTLVGLP